MSGGSNPSMQRRGRLRRALAQVTLLELLALALAIVAIVLFGLLARSALDAEVAALNRSALTSIHRLSSPTLDTVAIAITWLGNVPTIVVLGVAIGIALRRSGRRIDAWVLGAVLAGGGILSITLKSVFDHPRPQVFAHVYAAAGQSFPSGHSLISYCLWGFVAAWLVSSAPRSPLRWLGAGLCIAVATSVALSRLYLGVHWPSDVLAGLLVAAFWLATCFIGRQAVRRRVARRTDLDPVAEHT